MATPFVSGIAAMLRAAGLSDSQVMDCIARTSSNGGTYDPVRGYGNVNADAAVASCTQLPAGGSPFPSGQSGQSTGQSGLPGQTSPSGGTNTSGGSATADSVAPRIRVAFSTDRRAHAARTGYVLMRVRLSERARVTLRVYSGRETAIAGRNAVLLARGIRALRAGRHTVKLALTHVGRRVVHRRRVTTATVLAAARDAAGNDGTAIAEGKIRR